MRKQRPDPVPSVVWVALVLIVFCVLMWFFGFGPTVGSDRKTRAPFARMARPQAAAGTGEERFHYETDFNANLPPVRKAGKEDDVLAKPDPELPESGEEEILL